MFLISRWKGIPMHQSMPSLNSICKSHKDLEFSWQIYPKVLELDTLETKMYSIVKDFGVLVWGRDLFLAPSTSHNIN